MRAYRGAPRRMGGVRALGETNLLTRMAGSGNGAVLLLTKIRISEDLHESAFTNLLRAATVGIKKCYRNPALFPQS